MILMAISFDGSSAKLSNYLKTLNYFFTIIFIIECLLKLFAYGIKPYFHISWNKFDFFVVLVSLIDWIVNNVDGIDASFLKSFQIIRVLKVLTVSRVLRLIKALKGLGGSSLKENAEIFAHKVGITDEQIENLRKIMTGKI